MSLEEWASPHKSIFQNVLDEKWGSRSISSHGLISSKVIFAGHGTFSFITCLDLFSPVKRSLAVLGNKTFAVMSSSPPIQDCYPVFFFFNQNAFHP